MIQEFIVWSILVLWSLQTRGEFLEYDDKGASDLCYLCSCSEDRTAIDCSRRGLINIPDGLGPQVNKILKELILLPKFTNFRSG